MNDQEALLREQVTRLCEALVNITLIPPDSEASFAMGGIAQDALAAIEIRKCSHDDSDIG